MSLANFNVIMNEIVKKYQAYFWVLLMLMGFAAMMGLHLIIDIKENGIYQTTQLKKDLLSSFGVVFFPFLSAILYNKFFSGTNSFFIKK